MRITSDTRARQAVRGSDSQPELTAQQPNVVWDPILAAQPTQTQGSTMLVLEIHNTGPYN